MPEYSTPFLYTFGEHSLKAVLTSIGYSNTEIALNRADPNFGNTLSKDGSSDSGLSTSDGGKSWFVETINISGKDCHPQSSKKAMFYGRVQE